MGIHSLRDASASPARRRAGLCLLALLGVGCAPRPLLERAIRARGGPLENIVRVVDADVHAAFAAGTWRWRTVFLLPDRYAWTIYTMRDADHYLFDGTTVRAFTAGQQVSAGTEQGAPLRSHARFMAVLNLDALLLPGVRIVPLPPAERPPGTAQALVVVLPEQADPYHLGFDEDDRLVSVSGPFDLTPIGQGRLVARLTDFRRAGGLVLPFRTEYRFGEVPLADERVLAACPNVPELGTAAFASPATLPTCGPP